jgi:hypothetical protein
VTTGAHDIGIWSREETYTFRWETVQKMRQASQKLLEMALKGELPRKDAFTPTSE